MFLLQMKTLYSLTQKDVFDLNDLKSFHGYVIPLVKMLLNVYLAFCLAISFQGKHQELKIFIANPLGTDQQQFLYLKYMLQAKIKKENSDKPVQSLHSQTWPILDAVLSNIKRLVEEIDLINDRNCNKEVEENRKILAPIIDSHIIGKIRASI